MHRNEVLICDEDENGNIYDEEDPDEALFK
jgi:hypothetical protein